MNTAILNTKDVKVQKAICDSDDRSAVLVGSAILERRLENLLASRLIGPTAAKKLLGDTGKNGPLGSFFSKILAAWSLGLISEDEYADLEIIRDLRNSFAHDVLDCDFTNPEVKVKCDKLRIAWKALGTKAAPYRVALNMEIYTLDTLLARRNDGAVRPQSPLRFRINGK
jgi:hypothetical protein